MNPAPAQIERTTDGLRVRLSGDIDFDHAPDARATLLAALTEGKPVVADFSAAGRIDTACLAVLIEALQAATRAGVTLQLAGLHDEHRKLLRVARLDSVFAVPA